MIRDVDILNKETIKTDLALIRSCLKLINASISYSKSHGEDFSASENEELHMLVSKIDRSLNKIKGHIQYETNN
ncbi:phosphoglycerate mutase [Peribacillus asahii]|uniref:Phosphoglycerate mutase n=1 Tax=Peribacillus asahii TaxID=228899 RepID=A0A3T0KNP0_9BACI|nr:phosphoglycerate mutase [Peribacillus asahii]AZV41821.1 phosphoglycerate mutase [Peribacillus asahii]USK86196.1 phosphoglycerate mutase [Peribacillus asahii]